MYVMEEKNGTYGVRSQISESVLMIVFIILAHRQHTETNEFHKFKNNLIENVGQGQGGEKRDLCGSIANV